MKYSFSKKVIIIGIMILFFGASITTNISGDDTTPPLPRWREGGTPYNPDQSLFPFAIRSSKDVPTSGLIESPPEYGPTQGVLFCFISGAWHQVVVDLVAELTEPDQHDEIAYVWVSSTSQMSTATSLFTAAGANMSKVEFIVDSIQTIWLRDYGPHFIWQNGTLGIVDSHYYQSRPSDNFVPTLLGDDHFIMPTYDMGLYYSGGNFQPGPNRTGFATSLLNVDNPTSQGFNESFIAELFQEYQGIDTLHVLPQLPGTVDATGHIDMWLHIIDEDTCIISRFQPGSNPTAITITENAVPYMEALGFTVYRTPAWNSGGVHYTYTNAFRVNDRYFTSYYGGGNPNYLDEDAEALANFTAAAGAGVEIIPIDCYNIIPAAGAVHCIVMQVPRYTESEPAVHVISPDGGELLVNGTREIISWVATDTYNADIPQIDLYYSTDGGSAYNYIDTTTDTGTYEWIVPDDFSEQAKIKVVATSVDSDQGEGVSTDVFQIAPANQTIYDFTTGASVDKFGWGYQTSNWNSYIDEIRTPVSIELTSTAYNQIASSDDNRYFSPTVSSGYESTHLFEFTIDEDSNEIDDIGIIWEGYAVSCTHVELYIWDYIKGQWCDGEGLSGQNRFMDNWAGNRDGYLEKHIRSNFTNYIDTGGQLTLLLYADRSSDETRHDYVGITVSEILPIKPDTLNITSLNQGWNFVSLPFNQSINLSEIMVNYIGVNYTWADATSVPIVDPNVYGWDRDIDMYVPATAMEPGYGYWIYAYFDCELWVTNISATPDTYITDLKMGWNAMGVPSDQPVDLVNLTVNYSSTDYTWTAATGIPIVDPNVYGWDRDIDMYVPATTMEPGYAYWIYAYQDCRLSL